LICTYTPEEFTVDTHTCMASNDITHQHCKDYRLYSDAMQGPKSW